MTPQLSLSVVLHLSLLIVACLPAGTRGDGDMPGVDDATPIFCYQCNSGVDADCPTLQANSTSSIHYKPCTDFSDYQGHKPFCRKIVQTIFERDNMVRVIRKCGWERHPRMDCYFMTNDDHIETVCQCFSDGCNSAPRLLAGSLLTALLAFCYLMV